MPPAVLMPDAALVVVNHLRAQLVARGAAATVVTRVPATRPVRFVLVRRLGGPRLNLVADDPSIGIECWEATDKASHDLAQLCRAIIAAMPGQSIGGVSIYRVAEFAGPADLPDPVSSSSRYVYTASIAMRGSALSAPGPPSGDVFVELFAEAF